MKFESERKISEIPFDDNRDIKESLVKKAIKYSLAISIIPFILLIVSYLSDWQVVYPIWGLIGLIILMIYGYFAYLIAMSTMTASPKAYNISDTSLICYTYRSNRIEIEYNNISQIVSAPPKFKEAIYHGDYLEKFIPQEISSQYYLENFIKIHLLYI